VEYRESPPPTPDPTYAEALTILNDPDLGAGTTQEQVAKISAARRRVFELADRAGASGARVRGLTRMLDDREEQLTHPFPWPDPPNRINDR
jgi:hypothetical protein